MANSNIGLVLTVPTALVPSKLSPSYGGRNTVNTLTDLLNGLAGGTVPGSLKVTLGGTEASGTLTLSSSVTGDTVTVAGVTFTEVASGAGTHQFNHGATDAATAANLAAAINADAVLSLSYVANTNTLAVPFTNSVTVTALAIGTAGNAATLAATGHITANGSTLAGGTAATSTTLHHFGQ